MLLCWAYGERFRIPATGRQEDNLRGFLAQQIIEAALDVMRYCAFIRAKLWLWRKLRIDRGPMMPIPGSFDLRSSEFIDGPAAYRRLVEITGLLSLLHGGERCYEQVDDGGVWGCSRLIEHTIRQKRKALPTCHPEQARPTQEEGRSEGTRSDSYHHAASGSFNDNAS